MVLKVTKSLGRESGFSSGRFCISWASLPHIHPFVFIFSLKNVFCARVPPSCWVVMGTFGGFSSTFLMLWLPLPWILPLTLSYACLITVFSVSVSWSLDLVSLCNWVFCLCLVFKSDTADACRLVRRGREGLNGSLVVGWSLECVWRGRFPILFSCPHFFAFFRDMPFLLIYLFLLSFPGNFNNMQPDSFSNYRFLSLCGYKAMVTGLPQTLVTSLLIPLSLSSPLSF